MVRARLASLAVAAGLGLTCGCSHLCCHHFGQENCASTPSCACGQVGDTVVGEGPVLEDGGSCGVAAPAPCGVTPPLVPQSGVPPLAPAPRLVPQPQPAPPVPYSPAAQVR